MRILTLMSSPEKNSLLLYSLWQIPMFCSFFLGNILLQKWIDKIGMERLMNLGIMIVITSLGSGMIFLHFFGLSFQALAPVFILYFFGYAMLDYGLATEKQNKVATASYVNSHKGLPIGNGLIFYMMHLVPIIGWITAPFYSLIAAQLNIQELKDKEL